MIFISTFLSDGGEMRIFSSVHLFGLLNYICNTKYIGRYVLTPRCLYVLKGIPVYVFMHIYTHTFRYMDDIYLISNVYSVFIYIVNNFKLQFYIQNYNICRLSLYNA